jgi:hypothetical protein
MLVFIFQTIISLVGYCLTYISSFHEKLYKTERGKDGFVVEKKTKKGKVYFAILILNFVASVVIGYINISAASKISISPANLDLTENTPYIDTVSGYGLSYRLLVSLKNYGQRKAFNLTDTMWQVQKVNNQLKLITDPRGALAVGMFSENEEILSGLGKTAIYGVQPMNYNQNDKLYFCMRVHYTDSVGTRGLFQKVINMQRFVTYTTLLSSGKETKEVEQFLKEIRVW